MRKTLSAFLICFAAASLTGCAFTTDRIDIQYQQQQGVVQIPGASNVSVEVRVFDQRDDKSKVSAKQNGYRMDMAPIVATEDVAVTIRRAIEQELQARGFQLGDRDAHVAIEAEITRFYNQFYWASIFSLSGSALADLNMSVEVKSKSGEVLYSRKIEAKGVEPNIQLNVGHNALKALNQALENGMKELFGDRAFLDAVMRAAPSGSPAR